MENLKIPIYLTTFVVFVYAALVGMDISFRIIATFFITVNVLFLWMVYKILKDGEPSKKTFDEYFYEDREDLKRS